VGDDLPIKFEINGNGEDSIDLVNTMLYVQAADATVEPVNLFLHNVFSHVNISLNGTQVSNNYVSHQAMIETLLGYGADAKKSQLTSSLVYADQVGRMAGLRGCDGFCRG